jgi:hypothetical protein
MQVELPNPTHSLALQLALLLLLLELESTSLKKSFCSDLMKPSAFKS